MALAVFTPENKTCRLIPKLDVGGSTPLSRSSLFPNKYAAFCSTWARGAIRRNHRTYVKFIRRYLGAILGASR